MGLKVTALKHVYTCLVTEFCLTLCDPMDYRLFYPWNSPGKNTGCYSLLQGIFLTQD